MTLLRPQGRANCDLATTAKKPHEHEVADVDAGYQEQERHGQRERDDHGLRGAEHGIGERLRRHARYLVCSLKLTLTRILCGEWVQPLGKREQAGPRRLHRDVGR